MGGDNATSSERQALPLQKADSQEKTSYVTVIFSALSRSDMIDPQGGILEPDKVFNKVHMVHSLAWKEGDFDLWEVKGNKLKKQDKVVFIDCSYLKIKADVCGFPGTDDMLKFLNHSIEIIKGALDLQTAKGYKGEVHFNLCGYAPVEALMYALKCILSHSSPSMKPYTRFAQKALDKYGSAFKRYEDGGFRFVIDYSCIYEGYFVEVHKETTASIKQKYDLIEQYCIKLRNHNDPSYSKHHSMEETMDWSPQIGKDVRFRFASGDPADGEDYHGTGYDKIEFHGRYYYLHELYRMQKDLKDRQQQLFDEKYAYEKAWDEMNITEQEYAKFAPKQAENKLVHERNEAYIERLQESKKQLENQLYDYNSAEHQAYMQGHIMHAEEDNLASYHDPGQIEFDGQYVTLDVLDSRIKRSKKEMQESDAATLQAEGDAIYEIDMYWKRKIWAGIRVGIGIGTFIWPPLLYVDLALEVFDFGYEFYDQRRKVDWTHLIGIGVDFIAIVTMHGGAARSIVSSLKEGKELEMGGKAYLETKGVKGLSEGKASLEGVNDVKITSEMKETAAAYENANREAAAHSKIYQNAEADATLHKMVGQNENHVFYKIRHEYLAEKLEEKVKFHKVEFQKARTFSYSKKNELSYLMYEADKLENKTTIGSYISDVKLYISNYDNLTRSGKLWTGAHILKSTTSAPGTIWSLKGIYDNANILID